MEDANGNTVRWTVDDPNPAMRPQALYFRTQRGDGFADAGCTLTRKIDRDYADLSLFDTLRLISLDGSVVYEGRIIAFPRSADPESQTINVQAVGWMSHAKDRTFTELYLDRDLTRWETMSRARRLALIASTFTPNDGQVSPDTSTGIPALLLSFPGNASVIPQSAEMTYDAGSGISIGSIYYDFVRGTNATSSYVARIGADDSDTFPSPTQTANLLSSASGSGTLTAGSSERYGWAVFTTPAGDGGTDGQTHDTTFRYLTVWGSHGLTKRGTAPNDGLYASDLISNIISRWCPSLDGSTTIDSTSYIIGQSVYRDPSPPYDAIAEINRFHQFELSVWEDRKFYFTQPTDLDDWDWEVRMDDPGVRLDLQGDSIEDVANGIVVRYSDLVTGDEQLLTPETDSELADDSPTNPVNTHGLTRWREITVPFPTLEADALQIGIAELAEKSRPKAPGTIECGTQIRDRNGNFQPAYKVRASERVIISDHPNDAPRRIIDTRWNDTPLQQGLQITVDNTSHRLDALLDRLASGREWYRPTPRPRPTPNRP